MPVADRHLWYTRDQAQVVEAGDLRARWLFAPTGTQISDADMGRLGLSVEDGRIVIGSELPGAPVGTPTDGGTSETNTRPAADASPVPAKPKRAYTRRKTAAPSE